MKQKERAKEILKRLKVYYKKTGPFAKWSNPLELVVATMLSAQCTDERVNRVTPALFKKYSTTRDYAQADIKDLEKLIYSTGYYKSKSRYLKKMGELLFSEYGGRVPERFEDLLRIPGVSKKSACIIGAKAFGNMYGVAVDTHVWRVIPRWGIAQAKNRDALAKEVEKLFPKEEYLNVNEYAIMLGRDICIPR
ncbi:MAG: endonuclease III, partial [Candidatus Moranbacteria bacterium]|nr:endonuclease III [Candidatus Moranbacteria bacterium]